MFQRPGIGETEEGGLAPVDESMLRQILEVRFSCRSTKKQFSLSNITFTSNDFTVLG